MPTESSAGSSGRRSWKRWASGAVGVVIIVVTFVFVLPAFADYSEVWDSITDMSAGYLVALLGFTVLNLATYGITWQAATPGLGYRQSLELTMVSTAVSNALPVGGAVSVAGIVGMLREWGHGTAVVARSVVITGVWNQFANVAIPIVSIVLLAVIDHQRNPGIETVAWIGLAVLVAMAVVLAAVLHSDRGARWVGARWDRIASFFLRLVRKEPMSGSPERFAEFRVESVTLLRRRWAALTLAEFFGAITVYLVLLVALRGTGVDSSQVTWIEALAAWGFARLLSAVPVTPGGLGIVEVGLTATLVGFGGDEAGVVAAVLLYRVLTFVPPIVLGGIAAFTWTRHRSSIEPTLEDPVP